MYALKSLNPKPPLKLVSKFILQVRWLFQRDRIWTYHKEPHLDEAMELQKKSKAIMMLKNLICRNPERSIPLSNLEREIPSIPKPLIVALIRKYPRIFNISNGQGQGQGEGQGQGQEQFLQFTGEANAMVDEEVKIRNELEPVVVNNLRKLLMMSRRHKIEMERIKQIEEELGLPHDFEHTIILKYPDFFSIEKEKKISYLKLEEWDDELAKTEREKGAYHKVPIYTRRRRAPKNGNFIGPYAFKVMFPEDLHMIRIRIKETAEWQYLPFTSPYKQTLSPFSKPFGCGRDESTIKKRMIAVIHELLCLTLEKRLCLYQIDLFHADYRFDTLGCKPLELIMSAQGIFYVTRDSRSVILKEAYRRGRLVQKSPLVQFYDRFLKLAESNAQV